MWKYRVLLLSGFLALGIGIFYAATTTIWWLAASIVYNFVVVAHLGLSVSMHRYFSHRAFRTTPIKHKILLALSMIPGVGSPLTYGTMHRHHHVHSDTELDTHSPKHGFFHSWVLFGAYNHKFYQDKQVNRIPKDLYRDKTVKWMHEHYYKLFLLVVVLTSLIDWRITIYFILMPVAYNMLNSFHFTWSSHVPWWFGNYRNFETKDDSQNNKLVSYMIGELHNNHHANPSLYNQAVKPDEFDTAAWFIDKLFIEKDPDRQYKW